MDKPKKSPPNKNQCCGLHLGCYEFVEMQKKIKDLETKLAEMQNEKTEENNQLKKQLHSQPAEIVEKIRKEFQKHLIDWYEDKKNTNSELYLDADWVWAILDTILKEYQK